MHNASPDIDPTSMEKGLNSSLLQLLLPVLHSTVSLHQLSPPPIHQYTAAAVAQEWTAHGTKSLCGYLGANLNSDDGDDLSLIHI